jgi:hypothetical protein
MRVVKTYVLGDFSRRSSGTILVFSAARCLSGQAGFTGYEPAGNKAGLHCWRVGSAARLYRRRARGIVMAPAVQASHRGVGFGGNHWRQRRKPAPLDGFFDVVSLWLNSTLVVDSVLALLPLESLRVGSEGMSRSSALMSGKSGVDMDGSLHLWVKTSHYSVWENKLAGVAVCKRAGEAMMLCV